MRPTLRYRLLITTLALALCGVSVVCQARQGNGKRLPMLIGTYTAKESQGIYRCYFDTSTGELSQPQLIAEVDNPSFMALSDDKRFLYAVSEGGNNQNSALNAFAIRPRAESWS